MENLTTEEFAQFQSNLRRIGGATETVYVSKILTEEERNNLVSYMRYEADDENLSIRIVEPISKPEFDFKIISNNKLPNLSSLGEKEVAETNKVYNDKWIVLQNRLLNAISPLELNERRLIMFLSPRIRKEIEKDPTKKTFVIRVIDFINEFDIKSNAYYSELEKIVISLQKKYYEFWDFKEDKRLNSKIRVTWISKGDYKINQGEVHIDLHEDVIEMLTVFDRRNPFTKYDKFLVTRLGCYGIILFELISSVMYHKNKKVTYSVNYLREKFNCTNQYARIIDFKRYVLDKAIKDIETHTSYRIKYSQKKTGREVTDITFDFKDLGAQEKTKNNDSTVLNYPKTITQESSANPKRQNWQNKGLTAAQVKKLAIYKDQFVEANQHMLHDKNASYYDAFESFKKLLQDPDHVNKFNLLAEFLALKKGDEPPKAAKKLAQSKKKVTKGIAKISKNKSLTDEQIDFFVHHPQFQIDHPVKGYEVGSDDQISYLKLGLGSRPGEFLETDFNKYI